MFYTTTSLCLHIIVYLYVNMVKTIEMIIILPVVHNPKNIFKYNKIMLPLIYFIANSSGFLFVLESLVYK